MRIPDIAVKGHLKWTRSGTVWATWRLEGLPKGLGGSDLNEQRRRVHRALAHSLVGEYMLLGLGASVSPDDIANQMLEGIDVVEHPLWAEEVLLAMDDFDARPQGRREYWISVPLKAMSPADQLRKVWSWANNATRESLALPLAEPPAAAVAAALRAAAKVEEALPAQFFPRRATVAEQVWIANHAMTRGVYDNPAPARRDSSVPQGAARLSPDAHMRHTATAKSYPQPHLDEGGQSDPRGKLSRVNPLQNRFLKVTNTRTEITSYQTLMTLCGSPSGGWEEDLDWIGALDDIGVSADWVFRVQSISAREARKRNARTETNLADQMDQTEGTSVITGRGGALDQKARDLGEFHHALGATEREVQIQATLIVAVGGATPQDAMDKARFTRKYFADELEFEFDIPVGGQEALWWAMWPGDALGRIVREYAELTTGSDFASLAPLTSTDLGDSKGLLFANNISNGVERPVLLDLWGQVQGNVSGSIGMAGEPGGGKSVAMKIILGGVHDRGGRFVAIDRTHNKEYGHFATSIDQDHSSVVDLTVPKYSLDPLRVFGARHGASQMLTLFSALLNVAPEEPEGIFLHRLLNERRAAQSGLTSTGRLLWQLNEMRRTDPHADRLAGLMELYSETEFGAVLFDDTLPPLDLNSRGIVFLTHGVALPTPEELINEHLFRMLPMEKKFGHAMYALLAHLSKEICWSNPNELALWAVDELAHVTASPQGLGMVNLNLRDGRKHGAPCLLASQDARDFGDEVTRSLIKNRMLTRQTDRDAAQHNLDWFQMGFSASEENVRTVTEGLSPLGPGGVVPEGRRGEALFRDARGRMGKIRTRISRRPERALATLTTPGEKRPSEAQKEAV
ncbi:ATP-binding protein [Microbacterium testaceum]|uniref:ATP-binding protein n=1 Tax=Microbacterium testaceum TaxID=2033 RepID=UPI002AC6B352|nr:ATP-binding protein [Microbacterium testaceum]MDZ5146359.1 ATP-binding protein [Microbacterium testaceum]